MAFFYLSIPAMILFLVLAPLSLILVSHHEHKELRHHRAILTSPSVNCRVKPRILSPPTAHSSSG